MNENEIKFNIAKNVGYDGVNNIIEEVYKQTMLELSKLKENKRNEIFEKHKEKNKMGK